MAFLCDRLTMLNMIPIEVYNGKDSLPDSPNFTIGSKDYDILQKCNSPLSTYCKFIKLCI